MELQEIVDTLKQKIIMSASFAHEKAVLELGAVFGQSGPLTTTCP